MDINKLDDIVYEEKVHTIAPIESDDESTESDDESDVGDDEDDEVCARCGGDSFAIASWCVCGAPVCFECDESDINIPTWCSPGRCGKLNN